MLNVLAQIILDRPVLHTDHLEQQVLIIVEA